MAGVTGETGPTGPQGLQGLTGVTGPTGPTNVTITETAQFASGAMTGGAVGANFLSPIVLGFGSNLTNPLDITSFGASPYIISATGFITEFHVGLDLFSGTGTTAAGFNFLYEILVSPCAAPLGTTIVDIPYFSAATSTITFAGSASPQEFSGKNVSLLALVVFPGDRIAVTVRAQGASSIFLPLPPFITKISLKAPVIYQHP